MSCRVKKYAATLRVLSRAKPKVKRMVIAKADEQFMNCLCECGKNVLKGNVPLTPLQLRALRPYKNHLRDLVRTKVSLKTLARKVVHGKYGSQMRSENAFLWLSEGKVDAQTSALVMAAQDAAIRTRAWESRFVGGSDRSRVCANGRETVGHILAMCQPHQWTMYKPKHGEVARCIKWSVARALDLIAHSASRAVPDVVNGPKGKVYWDPFCLTLRQMTERRPDLLVWQHRERRLYIIEVAVANDLRVEERTDEKRAK